MAENLQKTAWESSLSKITQVYTNDIANSFTKMNLTLDDYQKNCLVQTILKANELCTNNNTSITKTNITNILMKVAQLRLNISSIPSECYMLFRRTKVGGEYQPTLEFNIQGAGYEAIVRNFGVDVKKLHSAWLVREKDKFTYPFYKGLTIEDPTWQPTGQGKVIRVVYPVEKTNGEAEYLIAERESVDANLKAHISNNMNGFENGQPKYTSEQKIAIRNKIENMNLEEMLNDPELDCLISPAWKNAQSREEMIITKMKNNALKRYPKRFDNEYIKETYESTFEDYDQYKPEEKRQVEIDLTGTTQLALDNNARKALEQQNAKTKELVKEKEIVKQTPKGDIKKPIVEVQEVKKTEEPEKETSKQEDNTIDDEILMGDFGGLGF